MMLNGGSRSEFLEDVFDASLDIDPMPHLPEDETNYSGYNLLVRIQLAAETLKNDEILVDAEVESTSDTIIPDPLPRKSSISGIAKLVRKDSYLRKNSVKQLELHNASRSRGLSSAALLRSTDHIDSNTTTLTRMQSELSVRSAMARASEHSQANSVRVVDVHELF